METLEGFIRELSLTKTPIIVEGPKDKAALESLTSAPIITLSRKPLFKIIEEIAALHDEVIILTDLDRQGKKLYAALSKGLQTLGVRVNNQLREFLLKTTLSHVEGLKTFLEHQDYK